MFRFEDLPPSAKPTAQQRSRETRDKLIAALDSLLHEKDFGQITVSEIAQRAGVSTASIYQRFRNKNAAVSILIALFIRRVTEWASTDREAPRPDAQQSLRSAFVQLGRASYRQFEELRYVMRPAYLQSRLHADLLDEAWGAQAELALRGFHALLELHKKEIDHPDLKRAASMMAYFYNMMFLGRLLHAEDESSWDVPGTADELAEELADFACGYLGVKNAVRPLATPRRTVRGSHRS